MRLLRALKSRDRVVIVVVYFFSILYKIDYNN